MKKIIYFITLILLFGTKALWAQEVNTVRGKVTDQSGTPLSDVHVTAGAKTIETDKNGIFAIKATGEDLVVFEINGYLTKYLEASKINSEPIQLEKEEVGFYKTSKLTLPFREVEKNDFVGAASVISGDEIAGKLDMNVISSLKGKADGLYITEQPGAHRDASYDIAIRGFNTQSMGDARPLIIVDGVDRPLEFVQNTDIESITVLKDAIAKSFYKGKAANGVILVTTKRGEKGKNIREVSIETGMGRPTFLPAPLNSAEYAEYYNLARRNSGLSNLYEQSEIDAYKNPSVRYPSNNYYDLLLKDSKQLTKASALFSGGSEKLRYNINANYVNDGGLEAVGKSNDLNQYSVRSNLNFEVSPSIKAHLDIYGFIDFNKTNYLDAGTLFSRMSLQRPNEYPIFLESNPGDSVTYGAGRYALTGDYQNLYAEMSSGGIRENNTRVGQTNLGFNFDLKSILEGLSGSASLAFDTYDYVSTGKNDNFYSYQPIFDTDGNIIDKTLLTVGLKRPDQSTLASDGYRQYTFNGQLDYKKRFGFNNLNLGLVFFADQSEFIDSYFTNKSLSTTLLSNYSFKDKIIAEFNLGVLESPKLAKNNRYGVFPAIGIGWILTKESFLKDSKSIGFLKLKTSYGITGTDNSLNYFSYKTRWNLYGGSTYFGTTATTYAGTSYLNSFENPSIDWEKSKEFNLGFESVLFNNFSLGINYYNANRTDIPILEQDINNQVNGIYNRQINYVSIKNNGIDGTIGYQNKFGDWRFRIDLNANYSKSVYTHSSSWANLPANRNLDGKPVDAFIGLSSSGIIRNSGDLAGINQSFGEVRVGDLKYNDINNDGVIDQNDAHEIGNSLPRLQYGTTLSLNYKNFGFVVSGYGAAFYDIYLSNAYYRPQPEIAYFATVKDSFNPETGNGTRPALSFSNSSNNYRLSDFWLTSGNYFKLKEAELSFTLPLKATQALKLNNLRFYVRGNNLMTLSKVKDVDPEYIDAGFNSYPFLRTVSFGTSIKF